MYTMYWTGDHRLIEVDQEDPLIVTHEPINPHGGVLLVVTFDPKAHIGWWAEGIREVILDHLKHHGIQSLPMSDVGLENLVQRILDSTCQPGWNHPLKPNSRNVRC